MSVLVVELSTGLNMICQVISWICLCKFQVMITAVTNLIINLISVISFTLPLVQSTRNRFSKIIDGMCIPFLLLSLSYEPVFLLILSLNLEYFVEMQSKDGNHGRDLVS